MTSIRNMALAAMALALPVLMSPAIAKNSNEASDATIAARVKFFGANNVDPNTGAVRDDLVILSWATNSTEVASIKGRIVLLDTYINRPELPPAPGQPDLRRSPLSPQDFIDLQPEAIFLGHGHGDHADNAAYIAKWLDIPIYSTPETCAVMQQDVARMFNDPNAVNGGVKIIPNGNPVTCIPLVTAGSVPGAEIVHVDQLEPVACIVAFKHIHSGSVPPDKDFPSFGPGSANQIIPTSDPRELGPTGTAGKGTLYPSLTSLTPGATPVPGQMNLTTTGFGGTAGPISMFYQFILRGDNNFTFVWHNTTGPLKEGVGSDPGLPSPAVGAHLFAIMDSLPQTDVEFGSIVTLDVTNNGTRDSILYQQHIRPQVWVPMHQTDATPISSALIYKNGFLKQQVAMNALVRPEIHWKTDPDDFLKTEIFDPKDPRWAKHDTGHEINQFCK